VTEKIVRDPKITPDAMKMSDGTGMTDAEREIARSLGWMGLVSHRPTVQEAYDYAMATANSCCKRDKAGMLVAVQLIINTYAIKLAKGDFKDVHVSSLDDA